VSIRRGVDGRYKVERKVRRYLLAATVFFIALGNVPEIGAQQSFEEWQAQQNQAFQEYRSREDADFSAFLAREWEQFQAFLESGVYTAPKLDEPPRIDAATRSPSVSIVPPGRTLPAATDRSIPDPVFPDRVVVSFYGLEVVIDGENEFARVSLGDVSPEGFSQYWHEAVDAGGNELARTIRSAADDAGISPYDLFRLTGFVAEELFSNERDRVAAIWFLMVRNGYDMRIAYSGERVVLLLPSANTLYNTAYFDGDSRRYYLLKPDGTPVREAMQWRTYSATFPGSDSDVTLEHNERFDLPPRMRTERLSFSYRGEDYSISVPVNENTVDYLARYPHSDWWVHFFPPITSRTRRVMIEELGRIVAGRTPAEAANILIRFVQTAFPYETDQDHFGFEKWQAPEEILFYRASDCDDRSILYAILLREVLGWDDVAMLLYPGHLAVAVPQRRLGVSGDSVRINGETYIVTDPTYIGADIGMAMPQFRNVQPEAHVISRRER